MAKKNLNEMSFLDHLEELRWLLVRSTIAILIMATVTFFISDYIFDVIIFGPTKADFITYRFFCDLSHQLGFADSICVTEMPFYHSKHEYGRSDKHLNLDLYNSGLHTRFPNYII